MYRKSLLPAIIILSVVTAAQAQDVNNAYRYSNTNMQGTARSMGFGGTLGSVGGDFGTVDVNPAGLGVYRSSEFTFTPAIKVNGSNSTYLGNSSADNASRLSINNLGLVFTNAKKGRRYEHSNWKSSAFAIGINRIADFNQDYTYSGVNNTSSGSQAMEGFGNKYPGTDTPYDYANTPGYIGYQSYLLNHDSLGNTYTTVPYQNGVNQARTVHQRGGITELSLSYGGNYKEKLLLGFTVGVPIISYTRHTDYAETYNGAGSNPYNFTSFDFSDEYRSRGMGINLKLGAIYKVTNSLRFGVALHSPTFYRLTDDYSQTIGTNVGGYYSELSTNDAPPYDIPQQEITYNLTTPWKGVLSGTFLFKQYGFISVDYEYVGYSMMHYGLPNDAQYFIGNTLAPDNIDLNQTLKATYKNASNIRVGAEGVIGKLFMLRAGFGYYGNPYKNCPVNSQRIDISGGVGFHFNHFFTDLAYVHRMYQGAEQPYSIDPTYIVAYEPVGTVPTAKINYSLNTIAWTVGFKFGNTDNREQRRHHMHEQMQQGQAPTDSDQ